jgi:hypothetical protein
MIVEHEVIEQIEEELNGWPIERVCQLLCDLGSSDPFVLLRNMWRAGYLVVVDDSGRELQAWQCEQIWRDRDEAKPARLVATPLGSEWVHRQATSSDPR